MIKINKGKPPKDLADFVNNLGRATTAADYKIFYELNYEDRRKEEQPFKLLQDALLTEQGSLCCYCMTKIAQKANLTVEHFIEKSKDGSKALDYKNLLGSCNSQTSCNIGRGESGAFKHLPNPAIGNNIEDIIGYNLQGEVIVKDKYQKKISQVQLTDLLKDINEKLKLNNEILCRARVKSYLDFRKGVKISFKRDDKKFNLQNCLQELDAQKPISYHDYIKFRFYEEGTQRT